MLMPSKPFKGVYSE